MVGKPAEDWQNLITSIFLSEKTIDEVKNEQKAIAKIHNNYFALFHDVLPFSYDIFEKMSEGIFKIQTEFGRIPIQFGKVNILESKVVSSNEWVAGKYTLMLRTINSGLEEERRELWSIAGQQKILLTQLDFKTIPDLIKHYLKIRYTNNERKDIEIVISPPATIKNLKFKNNDLQVILKKTSKINDLQLNLSVDRNNITIRRDRIQIPFEKTEFTNSPEVFKNPKMLYSDFLKVKLIHVNSGLTLDTADIKVPLDKVGDPFVKIFDAFCSLDKLKKMLFEPENYGKDPDKIFENAITWLLSLSGYEAVRIGVILKKINGGEERFDTLFAESNYHIGSADIIAYERNERILLIDCDIGIVDPKKVQKLAELKKYFRKKLKNYKKLPIVPILFSPRSVRSDSPSIDVFIADQAVIQNIFEAVVQGDQEQARSFLYYSGF